MKKIFLASMFILSMLFIIEEGHCASVNVSAFISPDDVTITALETMRSTFQGAINSSDGSLIQGTSVSSGKLDANSNPENRWNEAFNDFVYTGLLPPTSVTLVSTTTAGTAYINGARVVKDAINKTYTASKHTFVDLSSTGTYTYSEVAINATEPSVSTNSIRLARVSTDSTKVLSVRDDRVVTVSTATFKVGTFTRDVSLANGTQAITGVGFKPKIIEMFCSIPTTAAASVGFSDGTTHESIINRHPETANTWGAGTNLLSMVTASSTEANAVLTTFDADGFTVTWNKIASPTGTATCQYNVSK